jgi:hypothetical protein
MASTLFRGSKQRKLTQHARLLALREVVVNPAFYPCHARWLAHNTTHHVPIGMVFERKFLVGAPDLRSGGVALEPKHLVVVLLVLLWHIRECADTDAHQPSSDKEGEHPTRVTTPLAMPSLPPRSPCPWTRRSKAVQHNYATYASEIQPAVPIYSLASLVPTTRASDHTVLNRSTVVHVRSAPAGELATRRLVTWSVCWVWACWDRLGWAVGLFRLLAWLVLLKRHRARRSGCCRC